MNTKIKMATLPSGLGVLHKLGTDDLPLCGAKSAKGWIYKEVEGHYSGSCFRCNPRTTGWSR